MTLATSRPLRLTAASLALIGAIGLAETTPTPAAPKPTPTPTRASDRANPSTFELLLDLKNRIVEESARGKEIVIGIEVTDTKEGFTLELAGGKIDVREGLPSHAAAVLSGRRSTVEKIIDGSETLSGAIKNGLVDVQGNLDKIFELLACCVHRPK